MATELGVLAAVVARVNTGLSFGAAYDVDDLPATLPDDYVEVSVSRRYGATGRACGWQATVGWRILTRAVSRTYADNARRLTAQTRAALEYAVLAATGAEAFESTPVQFETAEEVGPDDGWWSAVTTYTTQT